MNINPTKENVMIVINIISNLYFHFRKSSIVGRVIKFLLRLIVRGVIVVKANITKSLPQGVVAISNPKNLKPTVKDYYPCVEFPKAEILKDIKRILNKILLGKGFR